MIEFFIFNIWYFFLLRYQNYTIFFISNLGFRLVLKLLIYIQKFSSGVA